MTDRQLDLYIMEIAAGDKAAFRRFYDAVKNQIFAFALSIVQNYQAAEDVTQEAFIRIMKHAGAYQAEAKPKAWIFRIVRNCCIDSLKSREKNVPLETEAVLNIPAEENLFESVIDTMTVIQALDHLEKTEREIVSLYLLAGMKQTEIASLLQIPYRSVRSKYKHAIKKLRLYFADAGVC